VSLPDLLNQSVTIVRRSEVDDDAFDPAPTETLVVTTGELQQTQRTEPVAEGELSVTTWLLVLPAGTTIDTGDGVSVDGSVYEVVGDSWRARNPRTRLESHVEATLKRTGGEGGS
jgi:hypothetical protein